MNRQQRRKLEREKAKIQQRAHSSIDFKRVIDSDRSHFDFEKSIPLASEWESFQVVDKDQRQDFEHQVREFGEIIKVLDETYPPRIEHVVVLKPFPYPSSDEMAKACSTMLSKYSPHNYYAIITATPPAGYDGSVEGQKAVGWYFFTYFRESEHSRNVRQEFISGLRRKLELGVFDEATKSLILRDLKLSKYVNR